MVDAVIKAVPGQPPIAMISPMFTPIVQHRFIVPGSHLLAKTIRRDFAQGEHHMSVGLLFTARMPTMKIHISDHAFIHKFRLHKCF